MRSNQRGWFASPSTLFTSLLFVSVGFGCAPNASVRQFQRVQLIPAGKGIVYVYQLKPGHLGFGIVPAEAFINNNVVGCLEGNQYIALQCTPGPAVVSTGFMVPGRSVDMDAMASVPLNVAAGGQYYVRVTFAMPFLHDATITPTAVAEEEALGQLGDCTLGETGKGLADTLSASVAPGVSLHDFKSVYVIANKDDSTTAPFVADRLKAQGYQVKTGPSQDMPPDTQILVKIQEHWFWDMASYLLELRVELVNPRTQVAYATATDRRVAPRARRPAEIMATEIVDAIFNGGYPVGIEPAPQTPSP